jgi:hypothetical protein
MGYSDDQVRKFFWIAGSAVAAISVGAYAIQWYLANRAVRGDRKPDTFETWRVWSLRSVRSVFLGAGILFVTTPVGYALVEGSHGASDCAAFTMPCLAAMIVGLALLRTHGKDMGQANKNASRLVARRDRMIDPLLDARPLRPRPTATEDGKDQKLELMFYIISVFVILIGYIAYLVARPSKAIAVFTILSVGWYLLGWTGYVWGRRIANEGHGTEDRLGFVVLVCVAVGLGTLTWQGYERRAMLLPDICQEEAKHQKEIEECPKSKGGDHDLLRGPTVPPGG